jgi:hypothetical protein
MQPPSQPPSQLSATTTNLLRSCQLHTSPPTALTPPHADTTSRECFRSLAAGGSAGHVETQLLQLSPKHHMFLAQRADSATLAFPLHFEAAQDAAIACAFLQQFPEARRSTGGAAAPSCSYMSARVGCRRRCQCTMHVDITRLP